MTNASLLRVGEGGWGYLKNNDRNKGFFYSKPSQTICHWKGYEQFRFLKWLLWGTTYNWAFQETSSCE